MQFVLGPLIGPQITWSVPGLLLVNPPQTPPFFSSFFPFFFLLYPKKTNLIVICASIRIGQENRCLSCAGFFLQFSLNVTSTWHISSIAIQISAVYLQSNIRQENFRPTMCVCIRKAFSPPPWIMIRGGQESYGQRLISLNSKNKKI